MPEGYNPAAAEAAAAFNRKREPVPEPRLDNNAVIVEGAAAEKLQRELEIGGAIRKAETFDALANAGAELLLEAADRKEIEKIQRSVDVIRALPEQLQSQGGRDMARGIDLRMITRRAGLRERASALIDKELKKQETVIRQNPLLEAQPKDSPVERTAIVKSLRYDGPKEGRRPERPRV